MRVNLAVQVLSHSVAIGITAMVESGNLPKEALPTALFLEKFDKLFNCYNCSKHRSSSQIKHVWTKTTKHEEFLRECLTWLENLQYEGRALPCIAGWRLTIKASLDLWDDLLKTQKIQFLLTGRLNQDSLENLFCQIRGKGRYRENPDSREFRTAYRQVLVERLLSKSSMSNCRDDVDQFLLRMANLNEKQD